MVHGTWTAPSSIFPDLSIENGTSAYDRSSCALFALELCSLAQPIQLERVHALRNT